MTNSAAQGDDATSGRPGHQADVTRRRLVVGGVGLAGAGLASVMGAGPASAAGIPWATLRRSMTGTLYLPATKGYAGVAHGTNPRYDAINPKAVARCVSSADVAACVAFAQTYAVPFAVRSGGHAASGWSTGTGLVIDTALMNAVTVDRTARTATIGAGARLIDVHQATIAQGLGLPTGTCPDVGIAGLTMGGGIGPMTREWGLTCDQLLSATVVLADGKSQLVSPTRFPGLYFGLRGGGGGSFGVLTSLTMRLNPVPTAVQDYTLTYPFAATPAVLKGFQSIVATADPRFGCEVQFRAMRSTNKLNVTVSGQWTGPVAETNGQVDALVTAIGVTPTTRTVLTQTFSEAVLDHAGCTSYGTCVPGADIKRVPGSAASSMVSTPLTDAAITVFMAQVRAGLQVAGQTYTGCTLDGMRGAVSSTTTADSSFGHRSALFMIHYLARWNAKQPGLDPAPFDSYVEGFRNAMTPYVGPAAYVNYQDPFIADFGNAYWPGTYDRLRSVKTSVDPGNVFRFAQSVPPA